MKMVENPVEAKNTKVTQEEFEKMSPEEREKAIDKSVKEYIKWAKKDKARYKRAYNNWCKRHNDE